MDLKNVCLIKDDNLYNYLKFLFIATLQILASLFNL